MKAYGSVTENWGKTYKTVVIGTQTWMAENLKYTVGDSVCYDNNYVNCSTYGHLYTWSAAMGLDPSCNTTVCSSLIQSPHRGICPSGWHIPSSEDWGKLFRYVDGTTGTNAGYTSTTAGRYLKAASRWNNNGNGTDEYGFSALPGGLGIGGGVFSNGGDYGAWWSASEYDSYNVYYSAMIVDREVAGWNDGDKGVLFSVRCLQD